MENGKSSFKGVKVWCGVAASLMVVLIIVLTALVFTVFKPKDPIVTVHPEGAEKIMEGLINGDTNTTVPMILTIKNRNYASFKFKNSTSDVFYHDNVVASIPLPENIAPARSQINITTTATFLLTKILNNPNFGDDLIAGSFNLTSTAEMPGNAIFLKVFHLKAKTLTTCNISFMIKNGGVQSNCVSKIKF